MIEKKTFSHLTAVAVEAALNAGEILRQGFGTQFSISSKEGKHNLVTEYDYKAEKQIIDFITKKVPGSRFLAEESGGSGPKEGLLWVVDPLDGTVNFAHTIPLFSVSIALEKDGQLICGVIYQPMLNELFVAEKGKGAFLNGASIRVSETSHLHQAILATGFPYNVSENPFHCVDHFIDMLQLGVPIRRIGSAAIDLAYTACGRFDGFFEASLAPWDCAAGLLLIEEAGGKVTHWNKQPFSIYSNQPILATNGQIHDAASAILTQGNS